MDISITLQWWHFLIANIAFILLFAWYGYRSTYDYNFATPILGCGGIIISTLVIWLIYFILV